MSQVLLGLLDSKKFSDAGDRFYNHRRKILHNYPNGGAPLTGILSYMEEEPTNDSTFIWYEKRFLQPTTLTRGTNPLTQTAPTNGDDDDGTVASGAKTTSSEMYLKVDSTENFRAGQVVSLRQNATGNEIQFWVKAVVRGVANINDKGYLVVLPIRGYTVTAGDVHAVGTSGADATVLVVGTAYGEGAGGIGNGLGFRRPFQIQNQTYIPRTPFRFTGSVLQMGLKYDETGPYKERAKDAAIEHFTDMERSIIFGQRSTTMRTALDGSGELETVRTQSGIIEFLQLWDAGSTGLTIDGQTYAPYAFKGASTTDDDDQKRIIANTDGTIGIRKWNVWAERVGRYHTNKTNEKLVLCGSGAILALEEMFRKNTQFNVSDTTSIYGLDITTLKTPFGKFHFMTHPLFSDNPEWRYWALILDVWSLKYRPLTNRDTQLLKMRNPNNADYRMDEWLTEFGIEFWFPENNMLIKNIRTYNGQ